MTPLVKRAVFWLVVAGREEPKQASRMMEDVAGFGMGQVQ